MAVLMTALYLELSYLSWISPDNTHSNDTLGHNYVISIQSVEMGQTSYWPPSPHVWNGAHCQHSPADSRFSMPDEILQEKFWQTLEQSKWAGISVSLRWHKINTKTTTLEFLTFWHSAVNGLWYAEKRQFANREKLNFEPSLAEWMGCRQ